MADTDLRDSPSTAADDSTPAAREAAPTPPPADGAAESAAPAESSAFDVDAYLGQYESAPEDIRKQLTERLLRVEPIRQQVSAESSRAIQKARDEAIREREQREAAEARQREQDELERAFDLALSEDDDIDPLERDKAIRRVKEHRRFQQVQQAVLRDPGVQAWSVQQAGMQIAVQAQQHPELSGLWADAKADEAPDFADLAWRLARTYADRRLAELEPAIRADERTRRLRAEPNPDVLRSAPLPEGPRGLTLERYQAMLRRNDPELKKIPAAEIDALSASILGGA